jgi:hypothetical protein
MDRAVLRCYIHSENIFGPPQGGDVDRASGVDGDAADNDGGLCLPYADVV